MSTKILVVKDDLTTQELVTSLLSSAGHSTTTAWDGASAIEKTSAIDPTSSSWTSGCPTPMASRSARRFAR
jgi:PleD family two-component response regulator